MSELRFNDELKENLLKLLFRLAIIDGSISKEENSFIEQLCDSLLISQEIYDSAASYRENLQFEVPSQEVDRMSILYYALFLMKADQKITKGEERIIYKLGFRLGLNENLIRDMIRVVYDYKHRIIPPNILVETIVKYLN